MAEGNAQLVVEIQLSDGSIQKGFINLQQRAGETARRIENDFDGATSKIGAGFRAIGAGVAAYLGFTAIKAGIQSVVSAGIEVENSANAIRSALALQGEQVDESFAKFKAYADQLESVSGVSSELIQKNAALLVNLGNLTGQGLERATRASLDLAQALQIDQTTAFNLVAKAAEGSVAGLSRYGIKVDESLGKSEKFAAVLGQIEGRFGGLASTRLNTLEGTLDNLSNAFGDISEAIGKFFTQSPILRNVLNFVAESFRGLSSSLEQFASRGDLIGGLIVQFLNLAKVVAGPVAGTFEFLYRVVEASFQAVVTLVTGAIAGLSTFAEGAVFLLNKVGLASDETLQSVKLFAGATRDATVESFGQIAESINQAMNLEAPAAVENYVTNMRKAATASRELASDQIRGAREASATVVAANQEQATSFAQFAESVGESLTKMNGDVRTLGQTVAGTLKNGFVNAFSAIGAALVNGGNAFNEFGKKLLMMLGQIAVQVGTFLLLAGLGFSALPFGFSGAGAIAAGLALIVLGGALSALGGGGGESSQAGGGASGGGIGASPAAGGTELAQQEQLQEPGTQVQVVVQGNIFDSDDTGSRIVDLINKSFDSKGTVIASGAVA